MGKGASPDGDRAAGLRPQPPAASSQSSIPSAEGWIEWDGGPCPVSPEALVDYCLGNPFAIADEGWPAGDLDWQTREPYIAITHYRPHAQAMSAFGQDPKGLEAKPASAVPVGDAPNLHSSSPTPTIEEKST